MFAEIYLRFLLENKAKVILKYTKSGVSQRLRKPQFLPKIRGLGCKKKELK
jgi:hypothetical protein